MLNPVLRIIHHHLFHNGRKIYRLSSIYQSIPANPGFFYMTESKERLSQRKSNLRSNFQNSNAVFYHFLKSFFRLIIGRMSFQHYLRMFSAGFTQAPRLFSVINVNLVVSKLYTGLDHNRNYIVYSVFYTLRFKFCTICGKHMLQCFGFVIWDLPMVVIADSDIESYEDLAGKRVGLSPVGSSTASVLNLVFDAYGISDSIRLDNFTWNEGYTALKDGRLDTFVGSWSNGSPISGLIELKATDGIRLLSLDPEIVDKITEMNAGVGGGYLTHAEEESIPEGTEILCPTNSGLIVADASVPEETMYQYTKAVLEHLDTLKNTSVYFNGFEDVCTNVCIESVPFHPGAARALKEAGYWKDTFTVYGE